MKKTIILAVLALALSFTVQSHAQTQTGTFTLSGTTEKVTLPTPSMTPYSAINVPASDLAAKLADAQAQCPAGKKVFTLGSYLNQKTGLYYVSATYR